MSNPCFVYDITFSKKRNPDKAAIISFFISFCKVWVIQLERGDTTDYEHWQCRLNLKEKIRKSGLIKLLLNHELVVHENAITNTSKTCASGDNFWNYCTKEFTRIEGPWTSRDAPLTKQMKLFNEWGCRPWMSDLKEKAVQFDLRAIDLIYDIDGNNGKSMFSEHMEYIGVAEEVPPFRMMDDIFQWVASRPIKKCYIFDMPRGMKKDKLADFYSGIEVIKNGVAYDKRYAAKKIRFDRPRIFVFTNSLPAFNLMSKDRWNVWSLYNNQLKTYLIDDYAWLPSDED